MKERHPETEALPQWEQHQRLCSTCCCCTAAGINGSTRQHLQIVYYSILYDQTNLLVHQHLRVPSNRQAMRFVWWLPCLQRQLFSLQKSRTSTIMYHDARSRCKASRLHLVISLPSCQGQTIIVHLSTLNFDVTWIQAMQKKKGKKADYGVARTNYQHIHMADKTIQLMFNAFAKFCIPKWL